MCGGDPLSLMTRGVQIKQCLFCKRNVLFYEKQKENNGTHTYIHSFLLRSGQATEAVHEASSSRGGSPLLTRRGYRGAGVTEGHRQFTGGAPPMAMVLLPGV